MKKMYYILFIVGLYLFSQVFQEYLLMYGLFQGIAVGLLIAFICKFLFKMVTQTFLTIAIIVGILYFLVSAGYIVIPFELTNLLSGIL